MKICWVEHQRNKEVLCKIEEGESLPKMAGRQKIWRDMYYEEGVC